MYDLTFDLQNVQPMDHNMSKNKIRFNCKQYKKYLIYISEMALKNSTVGEQCPTVAEILASPIAKYITLVANNCRYSGTGENIIVNYVLPLFLKDNAEASKEDNINWSEVTTGTFDNKYWKEMKTEITTLESLGAWGIFELYDNMNVIKLKWSFKRKHYIDSLIKNAKAESCANVNQKLEEIDFFGTYAPVVQWTTIQLILTIEILRGLKSKQGDVVANFIHADIVEGENVYINTPKRFCVLS